MLLCQGMRLLSVQHVKLEYPLPLPPLQLHYLPLKVPTEVTASASQCQNASIKKVDTEYTRILRSRSKVEDTVNCQIVLSFE